MNDVKDPIPLEYGSPDSRAPGPLRRGIACILGALAGIFALPKLLFGVVGVGYALMASTRADRLGDLFEAGMFLIIGLFCAFMCVRWCKPIFTKPEPGSPGNRLAANQPTQRTRDGGSL